MIPAEVREQVRARVDLAELIGQYVPLRKAGSSLVARCPFHQEKTPSFHVSPDRGLFFCFGCKAAGDVFTFFERIEGVSFGEALRTLAERAGIEIVEEVRDPGRVAEERRTRELSERLQSACEAAAAFYEECLANDELAAIAREELVRRGVSDEIRTRFRIGYAPARWDALSEHLRRRGVSPADAELAGLLVPGKRSGHYDRFRHRLMFPIWDRHGRVVAFSGRILPVTEDMPEGIVPEDAGKYVNSPETPLFKKSDQLFGLQAARMSMRQRAEAILVEGNFDVVAMHQHGFEHTVAPLGTAFTDVQAKLLRRYAETVTIVFDADEAGRKAARAAYAACLRAGLSACVALLPHEVGKDPDEVLRAAGGLELLSQRIKSAPSILEWLIDDAAVEWADNVGHRMEILRSVAELLAAVTDRVEQRVYIERTAQRLSLFARDVESAVRNAERNLRSAPAVPPLGSARGDGRASSGHFSEGKSESDRRVDTIARASALVVRTLLRHPSLLADSRTNDLLDLLDPVFAQPLVAEAKRQWSVAGRLDGPSLIARADDERRRTWLGEQLIASDESQSDDTAREVLDYCAGKLKELWDRQSVKNLRQESARALVAGDEARALTLLRQAQLIEQRIVAASKNRGAA